MMCTKSVCIFVGGFGLVLWCFINMSLIQYITNCMLVLESCLVFRAAICIIRYAVVHAHTLIETYTYHANDSVERCVWVLNSQRSRWQVGDLVQVTTVVDKRKDKTRKEKKRKDK
jgi:hypothetical protein